MGARKRIAAEKRKELRKTQYSITLKNCPISQRKVRAVVELIKGKPVEHALAILKNSVFGSSIYLYKLLLSAIDSWKAKTENKIRLEEAGLYVKSVKVDGARMLKRIQPAPQGRAHRIRKRFSHITIELGSKTEEQNKVNETVKE
ncbi:MAG: 50S ribosomal protein L22 [Bacteroidales bacterium]|nr:50S ribosomal protein L22 [Bacteroidales bacterium]